MSMSRAAIRSLVRRGLPVLQTARTVRFVSSALRANVIAAPASVLKTAMPVRRFAAAGLPSHFVVKFPNLSPTMKTGKLMGWKVKVGDKVSAGDVLGEVETDKATVAFDTTEEGYVARLFVEPGDNEITVGETIMIIAEEKGDVAAFANVQASAFGASSAAPAAAPAAAKAAPAPAPAAAAPAPAAPAAAAASSSGDRVIASPLAKRLAAAAQLTLQGVTGTGTGNRITKADVEALVAGRQSAAAAAPAAAAPASSPAPVATESYTDLPLSNMRKVIASRLLQSKQTIPHYYLSIDVRVDEVLELRQRLNKDADGKFKLSVNDFVIKAAALALKQVPQANSSWHDTFIRQHNTADISVAVATDNGLITPIVTGAEAKGLATIAGDVKALADKARSNKLAPHEYQGGTFTISNLGMFGVKSFSAIINPPQACILAVGGIEKQLVPGEEAPAVANVMTVTLSCDHRVVDGAVGAQWLQAFKKYFETPVKMLL